MATECWVPHQRSLRSLKGGIGFKLQVAVKNWILLNYCKFFIHLYGFGSERKLQHRREIIKCNKDGEEKQRISGRMPDKAISI